jgi:transcriptional regulator with XRE-family HTH domain
MRTLKELRHARMLTLTELAVRADVAYATVQAVETHKREPSIRTIRKISEALSVDPGEVTEFARALEERAARLAA